MVRMKNPLIIFNDNVEKIIVSELKSLFIKNIINAKESKRYIIYNITEDKDTITITIRKSNNRIYCINDIKLAKIYKPYDSYLIINELVDLLELGDCEEFLSERNNLEKSMFNIFNIMSDTKFFFIFVLLVNL